MLLLNKVSIAIHVDSGHIPAGMQLFLWNSHSGRFLSFLQGQ